MRTVRSALVFALAVGAGALLATTPCPSGAQAAPRAETIVLAYGDFGPQVMAYETIGYGWYQWNRVGDCDASAPADDVRVVVYRNITEHEARRRYPVVVHKQDYRYLAYDAALEYLDEQERAASDWELADVALRLRTTRERIVSELGP